MTMRKQIIDVWTIAVVAVAILAVNTNAADITYEGYQGNVESPADDPTTGWRNPTPAKPLDLDGDNILGSDGYYAFGSAISQPSYISSWALYANLGLNWSTGYGVADDPADPTGADTKPFGRWAGDSGPDGSMFEFTITGTDLDGKTLTVGLLFGHWTTPKTYQFELRQYAGGSGTASSPVFSSSGGALEVAYFNVTGASAGDTFVVITSASESSRNMIGWTFDTSAAGPTPTPGTVFYVK